MWEPMKVERFKDGVEAFLMLLHDNTAQIHVMKGLRHAVATIESPYTAKTCDEAMRRAVSQLERNCAEGPKVGDMITKIDRATGEFWCNGSLGPFKLEA